MSLQHLANRYAKVSDKMAGRPSRRTQQWCMEEEQAIEAAAHGLGLTMRDVFAKALPDMEGGKRLCP